MLTVMSEKDTEVSTCMKLIGHAKSAVEGQFYGLRVEGVDSYEREGHRGPRMHVQFMDWTCQEHGRRANTLIYPMHFMVFD